MAGHMQLAVVPPLHRPLRSEIAPDPLLDRLARHVESSVLSMLDPDRIEAVAEDMRIVERHRVHHAGLVVCAFILSAFERSTDTEGRLLDARLTYQTLGGPDSCKTSFRNMGLKVVPVMHEMMRRRMDQLAQSAEHPELRGRLKSFADVLIPDGCAFKLASALSGIYRGTGQPAELKLHAVYSVRRATAMSVELSAGSVHDSDRFWPKRWEPGALYIWDLGFNSHERFIEAVQAGAVVLQRLKDGANPIVLASYGKTGHRRELRDDRGRPMRLEDACQFELVHQQRVLDLDVEIEDAKHRKVIARVVCVPHGGEDRYYLTTLPREIFTPYDVAEMYRVRWEVELFFRNWKGAVRLDQVRHLSHPQSLQLAITASMLAALLARDISVGLERLAAEHAAQERAVSP
jgi:Transposase DDE domain